LPTLITGAGLIGTAFAQFATRRAESVLFLDSEPRENYIQMKLGSAGFKLIRKDIRDLPALVNLIQLHHVDTIVHTAGLIGNRVADSIYNGFQINLGGTLNVAEAIRLTHVKRLVHISTFGVYDRRRDTIGPVAEDFPRGPGGAYGNLKTAKELLLEACQKQYGFEMIILRPATVFGFGHFWSGSRGGEKMQRLLQDGLEGMPVKIPFNQTMANEYVYAKDVGKAVDLAATVQLPAETIFNIGSGIVTPFEDIVETVRRFIPSLQVEVEASEPPLSKTQPLDISKAKKYLGWEPDYSLEKAFEDFIQEVKKINPYSAKHAS